MEEYCTFIEIQLQTHSSLVCTGKLSYATNKSEVLQDLQSGYKKLNKSGDFKSEQYVWSRVRIWPQESPFAP
jgi:hypothetical protein